MPQDHNPFRALDAARRQSGPARSAMRFAFVGRVSTEDNQDPVTSFRWQLRRAEELIRGTDGRIVATFFDIGFSRALPWSRRHEASRLLAEIAATPNAYDAIVVGEGQRCFYDRQFGDVEPFLTYYGVEIWVPELAGPYDPKNSAHHAVMSMTSTMSRSERQRIQERVISSMRAQVEAERRFQGGRPPYGYKLIPFAPHPNPSKAAEGIQLKRLSIDPDTALVVDRIFRDYVAGKGIRAITRELNEEGVPCPSAADPQRNRHRSQAAWKISVVGAILKNERYTGYEKWGATASAEVLLDPTNPSLGTRRVQRPSDKAPARSDAQTHEPIVSVDVFMRAQELRKERTADASAAGSAERVTGTRHRFQGVLRCGICGRKMAAEQDKHGVRYRCRKRDLDASMEHPKTISVRETTLLTQAREQVTAVFLGIGRAETLGRLSESLKGPTETRIMQSMQAELANILRDSGELIRAESEAPPALASTLRLSVERHRGHIHRLESRLQAVRDIESTADVSAEQEADRLHREAMLHLADASDPSEANRFLKQSGFDMRWSAAENALALTLGR